VSKLLTKSWWVVDILILISVLALIPFITGFSISNLDPKDVVRVLREKGYTNIKVINSRFVACVPYRGTNACFSARYLTAEAIDPAGKTVELNVYSVFPFGGTIKVKEK